MAMRARNLEGASYEADKAVGVSGLQPAKQQNHNDNKQHETKSAAEIHLISPFKVSVYHHSRSQGRR